jgi:hypothetical protein
MHTSELKLQYRISFLFFIMLLIVIVDPSNINKPHYGFAQPSGNLNQRPEDIINNSEGLMQSIVSPDSLMKSVIDKVRNNSTSDANLRDAKESLYSQGETLMLSHQVIPANDFLHLYDTFPFAISNGFIAIKIPCNVDKGTPLRILVGQIPNLQPVTLTMQQNLSRPGYMCLYNLNIDQNSTSRVETSAISDIVLFNTGDERIVLPNTSTFLIGITKIYPLQNISLTEIR